MCNVGDTILHNEPTEHVPVAIIPYKLMPHEFYAPSLADDVMDLQLLQSQVWRMTMDSLYLSINPRQNKKFGVIIGDVSGKAMKAAVTAIMTSGMLISEIRSNSCINRILDKVNASLLGKIDRNMFVSVCICVIDTENRILALANAGLNRPILVSGGGTEFLYSDAPRLPLGVSSDVQYQQRTFQLKENALLIFTTDGVNEAQNSSRQLFGEERLKKHIESLPTHGLRAKAVKDSIIDEVRQFIRKEKPYDDMTVLAVRIK